MNHTFDIEHAQVYGLAEAVILANFQFWITRNKANDTHRHLNRTWTYNSNKALSLLFPYLTINQIRRALDNLVMQGVLIKGNFNDSAYDRTSWYSFTDESMFIPEQVHLAKNTNGSGGNAKTLTDINTDKTIPPNPQGGAYPVTEKTKRVRKDRIQLKTFIERCTAAGEKPISDYSPLMTYCEETGLPMEFVSIAWDQFKREFLTGHNSSRLQADWRRHFLNYVTKGYYRLWYAKPGLGDSPPTFELSTTGLQAKAQFTRSA